MCQCGRVYTRSHAATPLTHAQGTLSLYMERMAASLADLLVLARSQGQAIPDHVLRNIAVSVGHPALTP